MAHARQQIREAVATAITGLATTGSAVYQSRVYPHDTLPCLTVYSLLEEIWEPGEHMGTEQTRALTVTVEARIKAVTTYDDTLDSICAETEAALVADSGVAALVKIIELSSTEIDFDDELEKPTGLARMNWLTVYRVDSTDPETIIP